MPTPPPSAIATPIAVSDWLQDGQARAFPLEIAISSTYDDGDLVATVDSLYSITTERRLIKVLSIKILDYQGAPLFRKNALYDSSYDKELTNFPEPENPGLTMTIPNGATEIECPLFTTDADSTIVLEFTIRLTTDPP